MRRPSRTRRICKWVGLLLCIQLAVTAEWELMISPSRATLWQVLLPCTLFTAWLWYRDRRFPGATCQQCGYNLYRNTSGVCPECGAGVRGDSGGSFD